MITEDYISFETAKLLKEKGYCNVSTVFYKENGKLIHYKVPLNNNGISDTLGVFYEAPTLQMAMKWLRKEKNIDIDIHTDCGMLGYKRYTPCIQTYKPKPKPELLSDEDEWNDRWIQKTIYLRYKNDKCLIPACKDFSSYEEACEAAISYCLKNLI